MDKNQQIDLQGLKKYQEFWALKKTLEDFCNSLDDISDLDLSDVSRVTLGEEIAGRRFASTRVRDLLSSLGLVDKTKPKTTDRTFE